MAEPGFSSENFLASLGGVEGDVAVTSQGQGSSAASASPASTTNPWQDTALPGQGLAWIDSVREKAVVQLRDHGLPTPRNEAWKYTNVSAIARAKFVRAPALTISAATRALVEKASAQVDPTERLVFVNGRHAGALSSAPSNGEWCSLSAALKTEPSALEPYLGRYVNDATGGFGALNTAFFTDGAFIRLAPQSRERILHIIHICEGSSGTVAVPRHIIVLDANARATVVESFLSADESAHCTTTASEIVLGEGAQLEHFRIQAENTASYHVGAVEVSVAAHSRFISHQVGIGGRISRSDVNVRLDAEHASCAMNGLYLVNGRQHMDFHTRVDHFHPHGTSDELFKGILDGHGRSVFNGQVHVHRDAQKTDSTQSNHNLVLSRDAEVDTKPQLEIFADDVKCSHGATIGQLDEDMLFYLRSRGLDEAQARTTLTFAFAHDVIERMSLQAVRRQIVEALAAALPSAAGVIPQAILASNEAS